MTTVPEISAGLDGSLRRYFVDEFQTRAVRSWPRESTVLDLGGHRVGKRGAFDLTRWGFRVVCLNLTSEKLPDVCADAAALPFGGDSFDAVVCAEVLEHVREPRTVVAEIARVLKPGGRVVATVPFLVQVHGDPDDYGRYTGTYWRMVLEQMGFEQIAVERQGGFWSVQCDAWREWVRDGRARAPRRRWLWALATRILARVRRVAVVRDARCPERSRLWHFTTGFALSARKVRS